MVLLIVQAFFLNACAADLNDYDKISRPNIITVDEALEDLDLEIFYQKPYKEADLTDSRAGDKNQFCGMSYQLYFKNLREEPRNITVRVFFSKKWYDVGALSRESFGSEGGAIVLNPKQEYYVAAHIAAKRPELYNGKEYSIYSTERFKITVVLVLDGEEYIILLDENDTVDELP